MWRGIMMGEKVLSLSIILLFTLTLTSCWAQENEDSIANVLHHIYTRFLSSCGLYLLWDFTAGTEDIKELIKKVDTPMMLVALNSTMDGVFLPRNLPFLTQPNCSAYIIISDEPDALQSLILSHDFFQNFDQLGRYVFVTTGLDKQAPQKLLVNDMMAWRPNAVVVNTLEKKVDNEPSVYHYEIWSHSLFQEEGKKIIHMTDRWSDGKFERGVDLFPEKLDDFGGASLKAVTFEHAPSIVEIHGGLEKKEHPGDHHYDGIDIRLLYILSDALNFKLKIENPSDGGKWGGENKDGTWYGLFGDIVTKKAHMGVANLFIHANHLKIADMTTAYDMEAGCFITPLPESLPQWMALYFPFADEVWLVSLVSLIVGPIILFIVAMISRWLSAQTEFKWLSYFGMTIYYTTASFFGIGIGNLPSGNVTRTYYLLWVWFGFLITVVYRSALTAFLTIPLVQPPIDTLEQLVSSELPAWGATGLTFKHILSENPDPLIQQLVMNYKPVSGVEEGIKLTAKGEYAMMENRQFLEYTIATNFTNMYGEETLHVMKECFLPFRIGMALPLKSPYRTNFNRIIDKIVEAGLVRKWFRDILFANQNRIAKETQDRSSGVLSIQNLEAAWLILGIGYFVSLISFCVEIIIRSGSSRHNKTNNE